MQTVGPVWRFFPNLVPDSTELPEPPQTDFALTAKFGLLEPFYVAS